MSLRFLYSPAWRLVLSVFQEEHAPLLCIAKTKGCLAPVEGVYIPELNKTTWSGFYFPLRVCCFVCIVLLRFSEGKKYV